MESHDLYRELLISYYSKITNKTDGRDISIICNKINEYILLHKNNDPVLKNINYFYTDGIGWSTFVPSEDAIRKVADNILANYLADDDSQYINVDLEYTKSLMTNA